MSGRSTRGLTVPKSISKTSLLNLSVEEENLAAIPFAILERRVGKRIGKIEIRGAKVLPDGTEIGVLWQVQGNNELGLPTEQDLDIFVALGVLTFRNNFAKTVSFSGREISRILNISGVHGKFYRRLKLAMDRFIPLRFRALASTDRQEEVKWLNVFQEANFSLDRTTGRCTGSVTWTDKLIQSMNGGFFRLLDAGRYMQLDGITAKHLYRFLAVAFESTDLVLIDARKLSTQHLGILNPPKYFSRLMQTLEPAFEQLIQIQVLGSYHVVSTEHWRIALHRHPSYVPERKSLLLHGSTATPETTRAYCLAELEKAGFPAKTARGYCEQARTREQMNALRRAARLTTELRQAGVMQHAAVALIRRAIEAGVDNDEGRDSLDWCEIALEVCRHKQASGQKLTNLPGLLMTLAKDPEARRRLVTPEAAQEAKQRFRQREESALRQEEETEERHSVLEYEQFRQQLAAALYREMPEAQRERLRKEKSEFLEQSGRYHRMAPEARERETVELILQDLAKQEAPPYERWRLRQRAQQIVLPYEEACQ